jgi:uncharacterized protein YdhG (YjbR/CyaY superfamily)
MAERKAAPAKKASKAKSGVFSDAELEAMQEAKKERKKGGADGEADLMAKIAEMKGLDRELAERIHAIVKEHAPSLSPKTWYGMPAYAGADGKAVCFFTPAGKFKERYASLGFNTGAKLDDGNMWPTSFALLKLGDAEEKKIAALVKKAAG